VVVKRGFKGDDKKILKEISDKLTESEKELLAELEVI
jgi:hypothetical protein